MSYISPKAEVKAVIGDHPVIPFSAPFEELEKHSNETLEANIKLWAIFRKRIQPGRDYDLQRNTRRTLRRYSALTAEAKAIIKGRNKPQFIDLTKL